MAIHPTILGVGRSDKSICHAIVSKEANGMRLAVLEGGMDSAATSKRNAKGWWHEECYGRRESQLRWVGLRPYYICDSILEAGSYLPRLGGASHIHASQIESHDARPARPDGIDWQSGHEK